MDSSENQIKRIVLDRMDRCGICHRSFEPEDVHVLSRKPDFWMMLVQCTDCHAKSFVAAVMKDGDPGEARLALRQLTEQAESGTVTIEGESGEELIEYEEDVAPSLVQPTSATIAVDRVDAQLGRSYTPMRVREPLHGQD
jgi:hypothetical protein